MTSIRLPAFDKRVWILFAGMALNQFGMSIVMPFISIYLFVHEGVPATLVGFAMFFSTFAGAVSQMIGGEACDNRGRYLGFSGLMNTPGFAQGPLIGGFLLDYFRGSPGIVWVVVGFAGVLCAAGFIYLKKLVPPEKNTAMIVEM